jgi:ATP-binding cassette, subfamily B, bacterial PglK
MLITNTNKSLRSLLSRLWVHISPMRRKQIAGFSVLLLLGTIAEVVSLGMVLPFLGVLTSSETIYLHPWSQPFISVLGLTSAEQLLLPFSLLFALTAILSGLARLSLLWVQTRLGNNIGNDIGSAAFRRTLYQSYDVHTARNSSEVIAVLMTKVNTSIYFIVIPLFMLISSVFVILAVLVFLFIIDPWLTIVTILAVGGLYLIVALTTKARLSFNSKVVTEKTNDVAKIVQEGLGGIRDVLIDELQETYFKIYKRVDGQLRYALSNIAIIGGAPRPVIEAVSMVLISMLAYSLIDAEKDISLAIPMLGTIALAAQRLLPLVQQGYSSWTSMLGGQESLADVLELLEQPMPNCSSLPASPLISFKKQINIKDLDFRYTTTGPLVLNKVNLQIPRGSKIGFIGTTGSGKSTLLDIIMGLISPSSGSICIDGMVLNQSNRRQWQALIAHVPQAIFLSDASIAENIALGVRKEDIDWVKLREAGDKAQISSIISESPKGYETLVGERGLRLSGGQRQRIGIARALYKKAEVLVFDEATSALDTNTESAVMKALESMDKNITIFIVAHRVSTLKDCDKIIALDKGHLEIIGNYQDMVGRDA